MTPNCPIWTDRYTRVTFLPAAMTFAANDEWHVDFCELPPNPKPSVIDPREIVQTVRVRETADGWVTVDLVTPHIATRTINAVQTAEQLADGLEIEAKETVRKVATLALAGLSPAVLASLADAVRVAA